MGDPLLQLYHYLPAPLRTVAASLYGLKLRSWRYGPETERLTAEALEREHWGPRRWKNRQEERLAYVLHRAATQVPYYREQWSARRRRGDRASWEYLEHWPILTKESLRANPKAFVADDRDVRHMYHDHTAGTTGTALDLWCSRETVRAWHALFELRARRWNGVSRHEGWATLGGQPVVLAKTQRPPFWVWNVLMHQLYLSANHISRRSVTAYLAALTHYRVTHMLAYSSLAAVLAREAVDLGLTWSPLRVVITIAEPLLPWQRDTICQGFGGEVRESYGMGELVAAATECSAGTLHLWPEVGWLEVLSDADDVPMPPGTSGRLICTSLLNADMPLIRYAVGDRGRLTPEDVTCRCGRTLPALAGIEGRTNDLLMTCGGRQVYVALTSIFYGLPVGEGQVIQETLDRVRIRYVPVSAITPEAERVMVKRLRACMGAIEVVLEQVDKVPRAANGKFQAVICNLAPEQKASFCEVAARRQTPGRSEHPL